MMSYYATNCTDRYYTYRTTGANCTCATVCTWSTTAGWGCTCGGVWYGGATTNVTITRRDLLPSLQAMERARWRALYGMAPRRLEPRRKPPAPVVKGWEWKRRTAHCGMARGRA